MPPQTTNGESVPAATHGHAGAAHAAAPGVAALPELQVVMAARELFWHNAVRELLTSLSVMQMQGGAPELFDGRISVITNTGDRIPIGAVFPMFACSIPGTGKDHHASIAVECTIFRIQTPAGEVYTLPVHEIRGLVSLTEELIKELEQASMNRTRPESDTPGPFGFAAFLSRSEEQTDGSENGQAN